MRLLSVLMLAALAFLPAVRSEESKSPELPRVLLDTTYKAPAGKTVMVRSGDDLQAAINRAAPGDVIRLQAGAVFKGNFTLPKKSGSGWIVIRSSAPDSDLPPPGSRMTPQYAAALPKIVTPNSGAALEAASGAHHYRLIGLEFAVAAGVRQTYSLITLGDKERSLDQHPRDLILDRLYIHGNPEVNLRRGVTLNSASTAIIDSWISDCHEQGADSQAIGGWNGAGPFKIVNNYLEGAGENFMLGGADPTIPDLVPSDIEFRRNHCFKPLTWKVGDPSYAGRAWTVKNLFELKNARRVLVDGNLFENNWTMAQNGFAILFTVRNQDGQAPWSAVEDVTFTNNIVRHSPNGINMHGSDDNQPSRPLSRVLIRNNLFDDMGAFSGGTRLFQIGGSAHLAPAEDVTIDHNTAIHHDKAVHIGNALAVGDSGKAVKRLRFTNNLISRTPYGVKGSGTDEGRAALDTFVDGYVFSRNVIIDNGSYSNGRVRSSLYPQGNQFPGGALEVGFTDYKGGNGGNYRLTAKSRYAKAGTDGRDIGCDFDELEAAGSKQ